MQLIRGHNRLTTRSLTDALSTLAMLTPFTSDVAFPLFTIRSPPQPPRQLDTSLATWYDDEVVRKIPLKNDWK